MRMRKLILSAALVLAALVLAAPTFAASGTVTVTPTTIFTRANEAITRYDIAWTSTAGGAVSGNTLAVPKGYLIMAEFVPGSGGTQPTDLYDAVLNDPHGVDLLNWNSTAQGANLSQTTSKLLQFNPPLFYDASATLDLQISNAGNAKTGTLSLWVAR